MAIKRSNLRQGQTHHLSHRTAIYYTLTGCDTWWALLFFWFFFFWHVKNWLLESFIDTWDFCTRRWGCRLSGWQVNIGIKRRRCLKNPTGINCVFEQDKLQLPRLKIRQRFLPMSNPKSNQTQILFALCWLLHYITWEQPSGNLLWCAQNIQHTRSGTADMINKNNH